MHPWGKWGKNFVEYGRAAVADALTDSGIDWQDVEFVSGADTIRNGYPGFIAGATFAQAMGWTGVPVASSYAACASGATALGVARDRIRAGACEIALVVGADTTPKGFFKPVEGARPLHRPGLAALPPPRRHQPDLLRPLRPPAHGPLRRHRRGLRRGQGQERQARAGQPQGPLPQGGDDRGGPGLADGRRPAAPARDLRHLRRRRRRHPHEQGRGRAPRRGRPADRRRRVDGDADVPQHGPRPARVRHRLRGRRRPRPS